MNRIIQQFSILLISLLLLVLAGVSTGCKRYEEGPGLSIKSRASRVENSWKVTSLSRNNIDITLKYEYIYLSFDKSGAVTYTEKSAVAGSTDEVVKAKWLLVTADKQLQLTYSDNRPDKLLYMDILRLTEKEMKLSYVSTGIVPSSTTGDDYVMVLEPK